MSGDPLDLGAIEAMVRRGALYDCDALTLALVAEVRRLRAESGQVKALADAWNETPDYAPSEYDRGRVEQRHDMTAELLAVIDH